MGERSLPSPEDATGYSLEELDEIIFIAVTHGINAQGLIRRRDAIAAAQAEA